MKVELIYTKNEIIVLDGGGNIIGVVDREYACGGVPLELERLLDKVVGYLPTNQFEQESE